MANKKSNKRREERRKRRKAEDKKARGWIREWADAILFAVIVALIIRAFFFQAYRIPTPSMEDTLKVGDFLVVSKISYGARTPMVLSVPFTSIHLPGLVFPWTRLPGLGDVQRYDVVVFNYPIDIAPIAAKTNYVKRCVGLPGDTLALRNKQLYVNGKKAKHFPGMQEQYQVKSKNRLRLSSAKVKDLGGKMLRTTGRNQYLVNMTRLQADSLQNLREVQSVKPFVLPKSLNEFNRANFSFSQHFTNHDNMPRITVPFKGEQITLTAQNWPLYKNIVTRYESNNVQRNGDQFVINGKQTNHYTIQQNYYFMMGDNRDNSEDSRFWGFVPHSHIVGKAWFVYFSWDANRFLPRFGRIFHIIH